MKVPRSNICIKYESKPHRQLFHSEQPTTVLHRPQWLKMAKAVSVSGSDCTPRPCHVLTAPASKVYYSARQRESIDYFTSIVETFFRGSAPHATVHNDSKIRLRPFFVNTSTTPSTFNNVVHEQRQEQWLYQQTR